MPLFVCKVSFWCSSFSLCKISSLTPDFLLAGVQFSFSAMTVRGAYALLAQQGFLVRSDTRFFVVHLLLVLLATGTTALMSMFRLRTQSVHHGLVSSHDLKNSFQARSHALPVRSFVFLSLILDTGREGPIEILGTMYGLYVRSLYSEKFLHSAGFSSSTVSPTVFVMG